MMNAAQRLEEVRSAIAQAAKTAGRDPAEIRLVAISKTHDVPAILELVHCGQLEFGENRVQEAQAKFPELKDEYPGLRLHMVGQLQSNKAREAVELFDSIHSVDRPSLVKALARAMDRSGRRPECFVQVNIGDEPQKGGCPVSDVPDLLSLVRDAGLPLAGLMAIPPADSEAAPYFALLAKLARRHDVAGLSMGMSADYPTAVMLGATHLRVGTSLFGVRP